MKEHISFSELKTWDECAYKHKLAYIDDLKQFIGNEYTAFGKAIHDTCEKALIAAGPVNKTNFFDQRFLVEVRELKSNGVKLNPSLLKDMRK